MRIATLMENTACDGAFAAEHGLSLYIETGGHVILFDAGQSGSFADNAARLGIDLDRVEAAVLSHGHYDHGGGLVRFMQINAHAPVYVAESAFEAHFNASGRYIGLDPSLKASPRIVPVDGDTEITEGVLIRRCRDYPCVQPVDASGLTMLSGGMHIPDTFSHEHYLVIRENGRRVVFSGCSHRGVVNVMRWLRPDTLVGGFHLMNLDPERDVDRRRLDEVAEALLGVDCRYYTCHCTGEAPYAYLKVRMGERLGRLRAGSDIDL